MVHSNWYKGGPAKKHGFVHLVDHETRTVTGKYNNKFTIQSRTGKKIKFSQPSGTYFDRPFDKNQRSISLIDVQAHELDSLTADIIDLINEKYRKGGTDWKFWNSTSIITNDKGTIAIHPDHKGVAYR